MYPALHRLEELGWVGSDWRPVGGQRRRVYRLTPKGRKALTREKRDWSRLAGAINAVLAPGPAASVGPAAGYLA